MNKCHDCEGQVDTMITREELQSIQAGDVVAMKGNMHYEQEYTGTVCRVTKCHIVVNCCGSTDTKYQERYNRETGTRLGESGWMMRTSIIYKKRRTGMTAMEMQNTIRDSLEFASEEDALLRNKMEEVRTYREVSMLTNDAGLLIRDSGGDVFQVTIVKVS